MDFRFNKIFLTFISMSLLTSSTESLIIKWNAKEKYPADEVIKIDGDFLMISNGNITKFNQHQRKFMDYSLDHKCKMGLDLSVGFFLYTPYVHMSNEGSK